jgi:hypothetical protein
LGSLHDAGDWQRGSAGRKRGRDGNAQAEHWLASGMCRKLLNPALNSGGGRLLLA